DRPRACKNADFSFTVRFRDENHPFLKRGKRQNYAFPSFSRKIVRRIFLIPQYPEKPLFPACRIRLSQEKWRSAFDAFGMGIDIHLCTADKSDYTDPGFLCDGCGKCRCRATRDYDRDPCNQTLAHHL